ncbi:MAG: type II toxin-antitoxin system VapC family toxin [Anaerolineales bacterium]|nr:type II toxin-antitoxin system VapC family toxin [Anaerolineales bacterium]
MKALLDTHTFLWWNMNAPQLSEGARGFISDADNEIFFSAASAWEIAIKFGKGRLTLPETPDIYIPRRLALHHFTPLPIEPNHALQVYKLPDIHQDPFDRMLVAQSQLENLPLLTLDAEILRYDVTVVW